MDSILVVLEMLLHATPVVVCDSACVIKLHTHTHTRPQVIQGCQQRVGCVSVNTLLVTSYYSFAKRDPWGSSLDHFLQLHMAAQ